MFHQPSLHTPVWCLRHLGNYFSPSCVNHSSTPWSRRTCYSLVFLLPLRFMGTRDSISSISSISSSKDLDVGEGICVHTVSSSLSVSTPLGPVQSTSYKIECSLHQTSHKLDTSVTSILSSTWQVFHQKLRPGKLYPTSLLHQEWSESL